MPEPLLYLKAMAAAAVVSGVILLTAARLARLAQLSRLAGWGNSLSVLAMTAGLAAGYYVLSLPIGWPPANGLARLLVIILPLVLLIELLAGVSWLPRWGLWTLRGALALAIPRILLHGSVYLSGPEFGWSIRQMAMTLLLCSLGLFTVWALLMWLADRTGAVSVVGTLVLTTLAAGAAVMLAGYVGGGAAALPLAACLGATSVAPLALRRRTADDPGRKGEPLTDGGAAILSVGVTTLFGLLLVGHFFGRLSISSTAVMGLAPLLGWASELPILRNRSARARGAVRIVLVAIPLAVLLVLAKQRFDRELAPLL